MIKDWTSCNKTEKLARWRNVLRVLRGLSRHERKKHWYMGNYITRTECGTIACAAGHCALDPWFIKRGFMPAWYDNQMSVDPFAMAKRCMAFFGEEGSNDIFFFGGRSRTVGDVILEVRRYIRYLERV